MVVHMAEGKKNHYVPKLYLRNFTDTPEADNGLFDLYNLPGRKHIGRVPFGSQMKEAYFYAKDSTTERRLNQEFEGRHAQLIHRILHDGITPADTDLLEIVLLLLFRTKAKRNETLALKQFVIDRFLSEEMHTSFKRSLRQEHPEILTGLGEEQLRKLVRDFMHEEYLGETEAAQDQIDNFDSIRSELAGLSTAILKNNSASILISSDHPVIPINPYLTSRKVRFGKEGLYQMGLVLLLPLSPAKILLAYDPGVYRVIKNSSTLTDQDVRNVNHLEILFGNESIYSTFLPNEIDRVVSEILAAKKGPGIKEIKFPGPYTMFTQDSRLPNLEFSFLDILPEAMKFPLRLPFTRPSQSEKFG